MAAETQAQLTDNLVLKKKARRRLVGTVALVILSLLILPQVLKNKSQTVNPKEPVLIMPQHAQVEPEPVAEEQPVHNSNTINESGFSTETVAENLASEYGDEKPDAIDQKPAQAALVPKAVKAVGVMNKVKETAKENIVKAKEESAKTVKASDPAVSVRKPKATDKVAQQSVATAKKAAEKPKAVQANMQKASSKPVKSAARPTANTIQSGYAVQLGVFADSDNIKKMQAKIALAGFESKTSSVSKGTRLRVGYFVSRQGAEQALETLKQNGLSGKIVAR